MTAMDIREQYAYLKPQPFVWLAVLGSALLHLGLVALVVVGGIIEETSDPVEKEAIITRLVKKGKKKPEHQLPHRDKAPPPPAPEPRAVAPKPEAEPEPKPKPKPKPKPEPRRRDYTGAMNSAFNKLAKERGETDYEQQGDPEGVADGEALIKQKGDAYLTKVYQAVKANYEVPELIPAKQRLFLRADVLIRIGRGGQLEALEFKNRSDNPLYDSAVEGAIRRAAPFPPPPEELADSYSKDGIEIPFRAARL